MFKILVYHLKRIFHFFKTGLLLGLPAQIKYKFPARKLHILCITGTDGKTTSSTLLYHVLRHAGKKVALLSTVAAYIGDEEIDTGFHVTTPDPAQIQKFMHRLVTEGYEYLVLETTSHGIYQHRLWGVTPEIVGVTNITPEHLDYHVTYDLYLQAKALLARKAPVVVMNGDDDLSFAKLKKELRGTAKEIIVYSAEDTLPRSVKEAITTRFTQSYNRMNSRMVYAIVQKYGISNSEFAQAIRSFIGIPGRMQSLGSKNGIEVIVDFAHTTNGLREALMTLRQKIDQKKSKGKLIAVFGCAGLRDIQKRPFMGRSGSEIADLAVFTAEDPRTEDIWGIIRQMKSNLGEYHAKVLSIADRKEAITFAIQKLAKPGDIVGIFGKGHERSMCYGTTEYPWSDTDAATEAMSGLGAGKKLVQKKRSS
jgi:UDP-N-acetylmuramoyl-L-alanyl-D-glutamate--2,6-diaminopimelate ligase